MDTIYAWFAVISESGYHAAFFSILHYIRLVPVLSSLSPVKIGGCDD